MMPTHSTHYRCHDCDANAIYVVNMASIPVFFCSEHYYHWRKDRESVRTDA